MNNCFISIKNLKKSFGDNSVLCGLDFEVERGKITVILGKSGEGKSVLIKNIIGLMRPDSGEIIFEGVDVVKCSGKKLLELRKKVGYLFQEAALFDFMTVEDNIAFPMREMLAVKDEKQIKEKVQELLELVDLSDINQKYPSELSGGMKKRVGLARALSMEPEIILFDEPTTGLDPITAEIIDKLILEANSRYDVTCLVISHDIPAALRIADKIAFINNGLIEFQGTPEETFDSGHEVLEIFIRNTFGDREKMRVSK